MSIVPAMKYPHKVGSTPSQTVLELCQKGKLHKSSLMIATPISENGLLVIMSWSAIDQTGFWVQ